MAWQSSSILPTITTPAADIGKLTNDLAVLRGVLGGTPDVDVPFTPAAASITNAALAFNGGALSGFRNRVINGNFDIWQRGTTDASTDAQGYLADRFRRTVSGYTLTQSQQGFTLGQTDVPGEPTWFWQGIAAGGSAATDLAVLQQCIEDVRSFAGQVVTVSFYARALTASQKIAVELDQSFGTGGSPSAAVTGIGVTTCNLTTTWQKFTVTATVPSISGKTLGTNGDHRLGLNFWMGAGSTYNARTNTLGHQAATFQIAQVQLERGPTATPFEFRPLSVEFGLCQRYLWALPRYIMGYAHNTVVGYFAAPSPVRMRTSPTGLIVPSGTPQLLDASGANLNVTSHTFAGSDELSVRFNATVASGLVSGRGTVYQGVSGLFASGLELT